MRTPAQTVQDQIRLWERETQRVELAPAHLYQHFEDATLYERSRAFAQQRGFLLWEAAEKDKQAFAVAAAGACACAALRVRFRLAGACVLSVCVLPA